MAVKTASTVLGEINAEECSPVDDKERYFLLWNSLRVANQLGQYNDNNTSEESIIFGKQRSIYMCSMIVIYMVIINVVCPCYWNTK